jgi:hypothetical protein
MINDNDEHNKNMINDEHNKNMINDNEQENALNVEIIPELVLIPNGVGDTKEVLVERIKKSKKLKHLDKLQDIAKIQRLDKSNHSNSHRRLIDYELSRMEMGSMEQMTMGTKCFIHPEDFQKEESKYNLIDLELGEKSKKESKKNKKENLKDK